MGHDAAGRSEGVPLDVEGHRPGPARRCGDPHSFSAGMDGDGKPALGGGLEDRKVARLSVGPVGAPAEKHLDEAFVLGHTPDLGRGRLRVLRRTEDRGAEARLPRRATARGPLVVGARELGHPRYGLGMSETSTVSSRSESRSRCHSDRGARGAPCPRWTPAGVRSARCPPETRRRGAPRSSRRTTGGTADDGTQMSTMVGAVIGTPQYHRVRSRRPAAPSISARTCIPSPACCSRCSPASPPSRRRPPTRCCGCTSLPTPGQSPRNPTGLAAGPGPRRRARTVQAAPRPLRDDRTVRRGNRRRDDRHQHADGDHPRGRVARQPAAAADALHRARARRWRTAWLARRRVRLLTLTGLGGSGKTRLATSRHRGRDRTCPTGTWFVDLAPVSGWRARRLEGNRGERPRRSRGRRQGSAVGSSARRAGRRASGC